MSRLRILLLAAAALAAFLLLCATWAGLALAARTADGSRCAPARSTERAVSARGILVLGASAKTFGLWPAHGGRLNQFRVERRGRLLWACQQKE